MSFSFVEDAFLGAGFLFRILGFFLLIQSDQENRLLDLAAALGLQAGFVGLACQEEGGMPAMLVAVLP